MKYLGSIEDSKDLVTKEYVDQVQNNLNKVTESTRNIWIWGNQTVTGTKVVFGTSAGVSIPAGTYTLSAEIERSAVANCRMIFYHNTYQPSSEVGNVYLSASGQREKTQVVLQDSANIVVVLSGASGSSTYEATWKNIQLEVGKLTDYIQPFSAIDAIAREEIEKTNNELENVNENVFNVNYIDFVPGMYATPDIGETADIANPIDNDNRMCAKFPVSYFQEVIIKVSSTSISYRSYMIVDNNYQVLDRGTADAYNNVKIVIPPSAAWMVVNTKIESVSSSYICVSENSSFFKARGVLSSLNITDLKQCMLPGWYVCPPSYLTQIIDLPQDIFNNIVDTTGGSFILKVYNNYTASGSIRQELYSRSGIGYTRTITSDGLVGIGWEKINYLSFCGNLSTLGITDLKNCQVMGYYTAGASYLSNIIDLPEFFQSDKAIIIKVYPNISSNYIRQELSSSDSPTWVRVIYVNNGSVSVSTDWNCADFNNQTINILFVGNSFTQDENSYLPELLKESFPNLIFHIGMLHHGNSVLADHVVHMNDDTPYTNYNEYSSASDSWVASLNVKLSQVINKYKWDIVSFTQANRGMVNYSVDIMPYLMQLIDGYTGMVDHNIQFAMGFSHIYATNYDGDDHIPGTGNTSASFYEQVAPNMEKVLNELPVCDVFPTGTAVQNARTTILDQYGTGTYKDMTYDGRHLQEGICCLVPAYVMLLKIGELIGEKKVGIFGSQIIPTAQWISDHNIPGTHGTSQGATAENCLLAAKCAIMAIKHPFEITDCSVFNPPTT